MRFLRFLRISVIGGLVLAACSDAPEKSAELNGGLTGDSQWYHVAPTPQTQTCAEFCATLDGDLECAVDCDQTDIPYVGPSTVRTPDFPTAGAFAYKTYDENGHFLDIEEGYTYECGGPSPVEIIAGIGNAEFGQSVCCCTPKEPAEPARCEASINRFLSTARRITRGRAPRTPCDLFEQLAEELQQKGCGPLLATHALAHLKPCKRDDRLAEIDHALASCGTVLPIDFLCDSSFPAGQPGSCLVEPCLDL